VLTEAWLLPTPCIVDHLDLRLCTNMHLRGWSTLRVGAIPTEMGQLTALRELEMAQNRLSGLRNCGVSVAAGAECIDVTFFCCDVCVLTDIGHVPTEFGRLTKLRSINVDSNLLTGAVDSSQAFFRACSIPSHPPLNLL